MSTRPGLPTTAHVRRREVLTDHLVRLTLEVPGWVSSGIPDEWVALTVPGQFQTRYYTVRDHADDVLTVDVVVHEDGLVTRWAQTDCVGDQLGIGAPKASFALPDDAGWLVLVGDLTALPAIARICASVSDVAVTAHVEAPAGTAAAYPDAPGDVDWREPPGEGESALSDLVSGIDWPAGPGYFWMAGESAQMREIRRHLRRDVGFGAGRFDVMGYWSTSRGRRTRAVDPGPIYARGKAAGMSDDEIWAAYDEARGT